MKFLIRIKFNKKKYFYFNYVFSYKMEWDPTQNVFVQVENEIHRNYLQTLNYQIEQYELEQVSYNNHLNDLMKEYDQDLLKELNSKITFFEVSYDQVQITSKFKNLDEIPNQITLTIKRILKFRSTHNLFSNRVKNNSAAFVEYIIKIANILNHINQN